MILVLAELTLLHLGLQASYSPRNLYFSMLRFLGILTVPETVFRRRFKQGWRNFENIYRGLVDSWQLYDNSGERAQLIEEG